MTARAAKAPGHALPRTAWAGSTRHERLPSNWASLRRRCLERDGHRCQIAFDCCVGVATDADHVVAGDDHSLGNLQSACGPCHNRKTILERPRPAARD